MGSAERQLRQVEEAVGTVWKFGSTFEGRGNSARLRLLIS